MRETAGYRGSWPAPGFTLIEIIAVLLLLAVVAAVVASSYAPGPEKVVSAAATLKTHLRYAQMRAMNDSDTWGIGFSGNTYTLQENGTTAAVPLPGTNSPSHTIDSGLTVTIAPTGTTAVTFDQWGSPGNTTIVITLSDATTTRSVTVTRKTGFIP